MAFSATVISMMPKAERISRSLGVYAGKVSISSYAQTLVELTGITKYFKPTGNATTGGFKDGIISVQIDGPSSGGYTVAWDYASGAFKCYAPTSIVFSGSATGGAIVFNSALAALAAASVPGAYQAVAVEAAEASAIGTFGFVAIGLMK